MLTEKRARFCEEFLVDLNATQAAIRAGYAPRSAYSQGHDLLKKPEVQARIAKLKQARSERTRITGDRVVEELARIALANIGTFLATDAEGQFRLALDRADVEDMSALAEIACSPVPGAEAESGDRQPEGRFRLKMHDKLRALELLSRHLGMFDKTVPEGRDTLALAVREFSAD